MKGRLLMFRVKGRPWIVHLIIVVFRRDNSLVEYGVNIIFARNVFHVQAEHLQRSSKVRQIGSEWEWRVFEIVSVIFESMWQYKSEIET